VNDWNMGSNVILVLSRDEFCCVVLLLSSSILSLVENAAHSGRWQCGGQWALQNRALRAT
jgi:hypothetical protein